MEEGYIRELNNIIQEVSEGESDKECDNFFRSLCMLECYCSRKTQPNLLRLCAKMLYLETWEAIEFILWHLVSKT